MFMCFCILAIKLLPNVYFLITYFCRLLSLVQQSVRVLVTQEAKYVESWPNTTSAWAGWSRFDASRKILDEQNIKKRTGPVL
jgi:hypothetical protein